MTAVATEVADQIVALRVELAETLDGLKDEEAGWQPGPGQWCVLEVVAHLLGREGAGGVSGTLITAAGRSSRAGRSVAAAVAWRARAGQDGAGVNSSSAADQTMFFSASRASAR